MALGSQPGGAQAAPDIKSLEQRNSDLRSAFDSISNEVDERIDQIMVDYEKDSKSKDGDSVLKRLEAIHTELEKLKKFKRELPDETVISGYGLSKQDKDKFVKFVNNTIRKEVNEKIADIQKDFRAARSDQIKEIDSRKPEVVDKENRTTLNEILTKLRSAHSELIAVLADIEERKKTNKKLTEYEKLKYLEKIESAKVKTESFTAEYEALKDKKGDFALNLERDKAQAKLAEFIEDVFKKVTRGDDPDSSVISKVIVALEKPVDETKEKFPEFGKEMDSIQQGFSQIQKEIEDLRKGVDKKVDEEYRPGLENRINQEVSKLEVLKQGYSEAWAKLELDLSDQGKSPTEKQRVQYSSMLSRASYLDTLSKKLYEKVKEGVDKKDQRENVKSIAGRVTDVEKMMKDDYDKLEIGKKYEDGQRATYTLLLDSEIISARDARKELRDLLDEEENQPTKTTLEKQLDDIDKRIKKLEGKVDKERVAKEKEVKEKLDAAEAEIEKMEDKIREEKAKEAAGKLKVAENLKPENQEKLGVLNKLWSPFVKYKNGLTYDDQKNVNDSLADPKEDIAKAKEWIDKMPEETEKEFKLKKRLMKKARRMSSRRRSVMIRHFFMISSTEKAKLAGNAIFQATTNFAADKFDAANDSIFSRRDAA